MPGQRRSGGSQMSKPSRRATVNLAALAVGFAIGIAPALAERKMSENGFALGPSLGCYGRTWSKEELAKSPGQVVSRLRLFNFYWPAHDSVYMRIEAVVADQGGARDRGMGGRIVLDEFTCSAGYRHAAPFCYPTCDAGRIVFPRDDGKSLVFRSNDERMLMRTGGECSRDTSFDLYGWRGRSFAYRVDRMPDAACADMR